MSKSVVTFASLNAAKACETPFEVPYVDPAGNETDLVLLVLGDDSETVRAASHRLTDAHRRQQAIREADARKPGDDIAPAAAIEDLGHKLAAVRLVGWRGMDVEYSPELALELCRSNSHIAGTVTGAARKLGNWFKVSPKA